VLQKSAGVRQGLVIAPAAIVAATVTTVAATATTATITAAAAVAATITATAAATITTATTAAATVWAAEAAVIATTTATTVRTATTAAAVATTATAATITTATFTWRASFCGASFVHDHRAAAELLAMHTGNGCLGLGIVCHFHKAEAFRAACIALHHHACARYRSKRAEGGLQIVVTHRIWQIANVQSITHLVFTYQCLRQY
jgi:hypothetical protein